MAVGKSSHRRGTRETAVIRSSIHLFEGSQPWPVGLRGTCCDHRVHLEDAKLRKPLKARVSDWQPPEKAPTTASDAEIVEQPRRSLFASSTGDLT